MFHPVMALPPGTPVLDLSRPGTHPAEGAYSIGRYHEKRPGIYTAEIFGGVRNIHVGVDLFGPVGTPVYAFADSRVHLMAYNSAPGDYGYTVILETEVNGQAMYALYGHLSGKSLAGRNPGDPVSAGEIIGWLGDRHENGGWPPHLHFQLSRKRPEVCDMPGVVSEDQLTEALKVYPDPRIVLGPIY